MQWGKAEPFLLFSITLCIVCASFCMFSVAICQVGFEQGENTLSDWICISHTHENTVTGNVSFKAIGCTQTFLSDLDNQLSPLFVGFSSSNRGKCNLTHVYHHFHWKEGNNTFYAASYCRDGELNWLMFRLISSLFIKMRLK